jgi:hypothetical protein
MGRTINKYREDEDSRRKNKSAKHSKNIPGHGMRVINNWLEEIDDDDKSFEINEDEYYDNTTFTQGK